MSTQSRIVRDTVFILALMALLHILIKTYELHINQPGNSVLSYTDQLFYSIFRPSMTFPRIIEHVIRPKLQFLFPNKQQCYEYRQDLEITWKIMMNVMTVEGVDRDSISLVTHGDTGRLDFFHLLLSHWKGKDALFIHDTNPEDLLKTSPRRPQRKRSKGSSNTFS